MQMMICNNSKSGLKKINESVDGSEKYILEGIFAELGVMNVNHRIYPEEEYLKHLQYLRDDIKKGEPLLGELDHPDDRFDVRMQHVSHRIIDLWYEPSKKVVMGKIELLNTPNGKLAQSIVDQGIPLHISSRASGEVNPQTNVVTINQIYTYDIVAKPGFAKAVLHRVNESATPAYNKDVMNFLMESEKTENSNKAELYGLMEDAYFADEVHAAVDYRKEALDIQNGISKLINIEDMKKHINEANESNVQSDNSTSAAAALGIKTADDGLISATSEDKEEAEVADKNPSDGGEQKETEKNSEETDKETKEESEDEVPEIKIIKVEAVTSEDSEKGEEETEAPKEKESEEDDESTNEDEDTDECDKSDKKDDPKTMVCDATEKSAEQIRKETDSVISKLDKIIKKVSESSEIKESVLSETAKAYPFTAYMDDENLVRFSTLNESQRAKVATYLTENNISDSLSINNTWHHGLESAPTQEPIWLRLADKDYRQMYESASAAVKKNLADTAQWLMFESKDDVDDFWMHSGLKTAVEKQQAYNDFMKIPSNNTQKIDESIGYSAKDLEIITEMAMQYN